MHWQPQKHHSSSHLAGVWCLSNHINQYPTLNNQPPTSGGGGLIIDLCEMATALVASHEVSHAGVPHECKNFQGRSEVVRFFSTISVNRNNGKEMSPIELSKHTKPQQTDEPAVVKEEEKHSLARERGFCRNEGFLFVCSCCGCDDWINSEWAVGFLGNRSSK